MRKNRNRWIRAAFVSAALCLAIPETAFAAGWTKLDTGGWGYQKEDGSWLADGFSPDGYYIDAGGVWWENCEILGAKIPNRNSFLRASQAGSLMEFGADLTTMLKAISRDCGDVRGAGLEETGISWFLTGSTDQELFSFYKDSETDGYILRLKCSLSRSRGTKLRASWYDYQVLSALLHKISASGAQLAEAVYLSWKEDNAYGLKPGAWTQVGDALIRYDSVSGAGLYRIRAAE